MATSKLWMISSAIVGAGAALMTTAITQNPEKTAPQAVRTQADATSKAAPASRSIIVQAPPGRLDALEREVARLRDERNARNEHDEPPRAPSAEIPNPEEERRRVAARFAELERHVLADPVDPSWSGGATEFLRNGLGAVAQQEGFALVAAECRTDLCRATLRWDSYEAAVKTGMYLPERVIPGLNCVKSIWLQEPDNPAGSYSSDLFLDCTEQRAGNVDIMPVSAMTTGGVP